MTKEKIIVFGTGSASKYFVSADLDKECFEIAAFADNNRDKQGQFFFGKRIIHPSELAELKFDLIIIASSFYEEIKEQLIQDYRINPEVIHNRYYCQQEKIQTRYEAYYKKHNNMLINQRNLISKTDKIVVYTAITGKLDKLRDPLYIDDSFRYICYTDQEDITSDIWEIRNITIEKNDYNRTAKKYKVFPNLYFSDYEWSIWIDGQLQITGDLRELIEKYITSSNMLCFLHPTRATIHDEAKVCQTLHFDDERVIEKQINFIEKSGFQDDNELIAGGFLVRKHNENDVIKLMNDWWDMIVNGSKRDQLSFNYAAWKNQFFFDVTDLNILDNPYFKCIPHEKA